MNEQQYLQALGKKISHLRQELGMTAQELADKVEMSRTGLYKVETGQSSVGIIVLRRIADALAVELRELVS